MRDGSANQETRDGGDEPDGEGAETCGHKASLGQRTAEHRGRGDSCDAVRKG